MGFFTNTSLDNKKQPTQEQIEGAAELEQELARRSGDFQEVNPVIAKTSNFKPISPVLGAEGSNQPTATSPLFNPTNVEGSNQPTSAITSFTPAPVQKPQGSQDVQTSKPVTDTKQFTPAPMDAKVGDKKEGSRAPVAKKEFKAVDTELLNAQKNADLANDIMTGILEGDDPIADAEWSNAINTFAPINQAQEEAAMLKLKQMGVTDGSMNSYMFQLARQTGRNLSEMKQNINVSAANRLYDTAKWGIKNARDVENHRLDVKQKESNLAMDEVNLAIKNLDLDRKDLELGEFEGDITEDNIRFLTEMGVINPDAYNNAVAGTPLEGMDFTNTIALVEARGQEAINAINKNLGLTYAEKINLFRTSIPGVSFNYLAYTNNLEDGEADRAIIETKRQEIADLINQDTPESLAQAREELITLANLYPQVFGDSAQYADWNPNDVDKGAATQRTLDKMDGINTFIMTGQEGEAMKIALDMIDPATMETDFTGAWNTNSTLGEENDIILELAGLDDKPITDEEKKAYLAADILRSVQKETIRPEKLYDAYLDNYKGTPQYEWLLDNKDLFIEYINSVDDLEEDPNTGLLVPVTENQLPSWNEDSPKAYQYYDWPVAFDGNMNFIDDPNAWAYSGFNYEGSTESEMFMGANAPYRAYSDNLDRLYKDYAKLGDMNMREWFMASKGGTQSVGAGGGGGAGISELGLNFEPESGTDIFENRSKLATAISTQNYSPSRDDILNSVSTTRKEDIPIGGNVESFLKQNTSGEIPNNPDGWMNIDGVAVQLVDSGKFSWGKKGEKLVTGGGQEVSHFIDHDNSNIYVGKDGSVFVDIPLGVHPDYVSAWQVNDYFDIQKDPARKALFDTWKQDVLQGLNDDYQHLKENVIEEIRIRPKIVSFSEYEEQNS